VEQSRISLKASSGSDLAASPDEVRTRLLDERKSHDKTRIGLFI
jgi:hypothetical protein